MEDRKNMPAKTFKCGQVSDAIWFKRLGRDSEVIEVPSIMITKSYLDEESGDWKKAKTFFADDLPKVATVAMEAFRHLRVESSEPDSSGERSPYKSDHK